MSISPDLLSAASPALLAGTRGEPCALEPFLRDTQITLVLFQDSAELTDLPLPPTTLSPKPWCPTYPHFKSGRGNFLF